MISYLSQYYPLSEEAEKDARTLVQTLHKPKGSFLIKEGQSVNSFFLLKKGLVRSFFQKEEVQITQWFSMEGDNVAATQPLYDQQPSREYIECLEDCEFLFFTGEDLHFLCEKHNCFNTLYRKIIEEYCKIIETRLFTLQTMSAQERYHFLLEDSPKLIQRVPLGYIASYLGISQETLSRVRSK
ncbi:MAG: Crp/Fnr family transcriptional regulator [Capnocytophaga sp.]|nr:Crp/Fnr family transcriptional regulator [Capnocytophaga sp.]